MAKQHGLVKLTGKIDQSSYYYAKEGGFQSRRINPNMSTKVREDPNFQNTRLYAREFGACASTAGAIIRGIVSRWRFMHQAGSDGKMTRECATCMKFDTTHPLGERQLLKAYFPDIQIEFNRLVKNEFPNFIKNYIYDEITWDDSTSRLVFTENLLTTAEYEQYLQSLGAEGFRIDLYSYRVLKAIYVGYPWQYTPASYDIEQSSYAGADIMIDGNGGANIWGAMTPRLNFAPQNSDLIIGGVLVTILPFKKIGGRSVYLQGGATAFWWSIPDGE